MQARRKLTQSIVALMLTRIVVNMTRRFAYPFVPAIARQLGTAPTIIQSIIALQGGAGLLGPVIGPFADRYQRRYVMILAVSLLVIMAVSGAVFPGILIFGGVMFFFGLAKVIYDTAMYAYIGDNIPFGRRGLVTGFVELSWAFSLLIIAPVAGILLAQSDVGTIHALILERASRYDASLLVTSRGVQNVMILFALLGMIAVSLIVLLVPGHPPSDASKRQSVRLKALWHVFRNNPAALGTLGYVFFLPMANEIIFINYGLYMEEAFGLSIALLGSLTIIISAAEIVGEFIVLALSDRLGKRVMTIIASASAALTYALLPLTTFSLTAALVILFVMFVAVETAIVSSLVIVTEVLPDNRAVMIGGTAGGANLGRVFGGIAGGLLYSVTGSFVIVGLVALVVGLMTAGIMWRFVRFEG